MNPEWARIVRRRRFREPVLTGQPRLPPLERFSDLLRPAWTRKKLTNRGPLEIRLEQKIGQFLESPHVSLLGNATTALMVALEMLGVSGGEVLTSPFTFAAVVDAIHWVGAEPVFCDIDPDTYNLDPGQLERWISTRTRAILPIHTFGVPCDVEGIDRIARKRGIPVLYDAAHTFGARLHGRALASFGTLAVLSFHATKIFSTIEGGCIVCPDAALKDRVDRLKNFGMDASAAIIEPGLNGKLNEAQAAFGLLHLKMVPAELRHRRRLARTYREALSGIPGLRLCPPTPGLEPNHSSFPIEIEPLAFGWTRDQTMDALVGLNVHAKRYFHPLCSHGPHFRHASAAAGNLPVAEQLCQRILCIPIHSGVSLQDATRIATALRDLQALAHRHHVSG